MFTNGGHLGSFLVIFPPLLWEEDPISIMSISHEVEGFAQFKELFAVVMALDFIPEPFNLFSDSLYIVNL